MSDEPTKDDALTPWQDRSLASRSAALVRRGLAEALTPKTGGAYLVSGIAKYYKGDLDGALDDYTRAIEINPRYADAYYSRGIAKRHKGDLDGSVDDYTKAIEINPRYAEAYNNRGVAKYYKGDLDGAIDDYTRAIEISPQYADAYNNRGIAKYYKGDLDGAIDDYTRAIEISPRYADAYNNRGLAKRRKGALDGAMADHTKALVIARKPSKYERRLPLYLLLDCSASMSGEPIEALRMGIKALIVDLKTNPMALETAYVSVITFSSSAQQVCPLTELITFQQPNLFITDLHEETSLGAALHLLTEAIDREVVRKTEDHPGDYRPVVLVMIDGDPTDDWSTAARLLLERRLAAMVVCSAGPAVDSAKLRSTVPEMIVIDLNSVQPGTLTGLFRWIDQGEEYPFSFGWNTLTEIAKMKKRFGSDSFD